MTFRHSDHFIKGRDRSSGERLIKEYPIIKISDLIISDFPDILIQTCGPLQVVIMKDDDRPVSKHLNIKFGC